ncbi:ORF MSV021 MTG motif gene family protein [Melanoplus sanguinipes entomopoxvirus]|uniref:ORF MSV021 MTG motif gene family protein n=1 Tax=Melanoplus sanguinipes entomopoxvirus TaxID=83191 RepID=Q9YW71_MSEPV|nr:ORF MSV021 MTG motif gene family protein [Melanoplus sanguinipes entomopoxvirus]AAC97850.1 ORF MSV021 MTG motif gene family protein [Melanoplus sanguinipes entomopoxvirus 'O']
MMNIFEFIHHNNYNINLGIWFNDFWLNLLNKSEIVITLNTLQFLHYGLKCDLAIKSGYMYIATNLIYKEKNIYKIGYTNDVVGKLVKMNSNRLKFEQFYYVKIYKVNNIFSIQNYIYKKLYPYILNYPYLNCDLNVITNAMENIDKSLLSNNLYTEYQNLKDNFETILTTNRIKFKKLKYHEMSDENREMLNSEVIKLSMSELANTTWCILKTSDFKNLILQINTLPVEEIREYYLLIEKILLNYIKYSLTTIDKSISKK